MARKKYYCKKCRKYHFAGSKIGRAHKKAKKTKKRKTRKRRVRRKPAWW